MKGTCQVELLSVGVTVIPGQAGHEMPSSAAAAAAAAVDLRCPITARSDAQPACSQKVDDVHVCPCLCQAPLFVCVCVCAAAGHRRGRAVRGHAARGRSAHRGLRLRPDRGGRRLTVRPSLSLVCPSSAVPFRHVPRRFFFFFFFLVLLSCSSPLSSPPSTLSTTTY